jgi:outer membrane protein
MKFHRYILFCLWLLCLNTNAQMLAFEPTQKNIPRKADGVYSLQECMEIALANNLQVKQNQLQVETGMVNLNQSKFNKLPSLNGQLGQGYNAGRSIDPYTNNYADQSINSSQWSLGSSVIVYAGYQLQNNIKQQQLNLEAAKLDIASTRDQISLNVIVAYLQILNQEDMLSVGLHQKEITEIQIEKTTQLAQAGIVPERNVLDLKAQLANDELGVVNTKNSLQAARLSLLQLMNFEANDVLKLQRLEAKDFTFIKAKELQSANEIFDNARLIRPEIRASDLRIKSAKTGVEIAKSYQYPTVSLGLGMSTQYSSIAKGFVADGTSQTVESPSSEAFVLMNGQRTPVYIRQEIPGGEIKPFGYFNQLGNNLTKYINLTVKIPIFNGFSAKNRIVKSVIEKKNAEYQSDIVHQQLRQRIEQAYNDLTAAHQRLEAIDNQVKAIEEAFRTAEYSFNLGKISFVDYNLAKTNLDKARSNQVQAKYECVFRKKIIDFYQLTISN